MHMHLCTAANNSNISRLGLDAHTTTASTTYTYLVGVRVLGFLDSVVVWKVRVHRNRSMGTNSNHAADEPLS